MIYVHIPFCRSFCTYCGFYSEICSAGDGRIAGYADALISEIRRRRAELASCARGHEGRNTLYIGGGTPSVLPLSVLGRIVSEIGDAVWPEAAGSGSCHREAEPHWDEFTLEANPDDIVRGGPDYARGLRELGVTRVSMGVQSFDAPTLRWMNRRHDPEEAVEAFRILREAHFDNISIDLIFGFGGDPKVWSSTLETAIELRPEHISAYQLSVEEGSAIEEMIARGDFAEAPEEECRAQYDELCAKLAAAGYEHYEVSNFALPGKRAVHNSGYWDHCPYVGLGPAAHSFDGRVRSWNAADLGAYLKACSRMEGDAGADAEAEAGGSERLSDSQLSFESVMLSLRTCEGIEAELLRKIAGTSTLERLLGAGALVCTGGRIRIPEDHFFVCDDIIRDLA